MFRLDFLREMDWVLLVAILILAVIGTFFIYSASFQLSQRTGIDFSRRQAVWVGVGLVLFIFLARIDYWKLMPVAYFFFGAAVFLLLLIVAAGEIRFGARRWFQLGAFTVQPSEFAKATLILALARYLSENVSRRYRWKFVLIPCLLAAVPAVLILKQPDLGTALLFLPLTLGMAFIGGARLKFIVVLILILTLLSPLFWSFLRDYQKNRLLVFIDPARDPFGAGYNIIQSRIAIGSGGLWGKGWLGGTQNMLSFLPERQTDFIFSVVAEEWGFVGSLVVLGLYGLIIQRLYRIARLARDRTGKLLAAGGLIVFSSHVYINVGMAIGLIPTTGLPLPLLSYGGSVTTSMLAILGVCESVYVHRYWC